MFGTAVGNRGIDVWAINWNDTKQRDALRENLVCLAKAEQYLVLKSADRIKTFGMGQLGAIDFEVCALDVIVGTQESVKSLRTFEHVAICAIARVIPLVMLPWGKQSRKFVTNR